MLGMSLLLYFSYCHKTEDFLPLITDVKALVTLSKPTVGDKVQLSFAHQLYGSVLLNTQRSSKITPSYCTSIIVPNILSLMNAKTLTDLD